MANPESERPRKVGLVNALLKALAGFAQLFAALLMVPMWAFYAQSLYGIVLIPLSAFTVLCATLIFVTLIVIPVLKFRMWAPGVAGAIVGFAYAVYVFFAIISAISGA